MSASEIQSKLVQAIRKIAELEEEIEQTDKKIKEYEADLERKSRQMVYLDRNCSQRDREIDAMKDKLFILEAKADPEEFENKIDECAISVGREKKKLDDVKNQIARLESEDQQARSMLKKYEGMIAKVAQGASAASVVSMFQDELSSMAKTIAEQKSEIGTMGDELMQQMEVVDIVRANNRYLEQYRVDSIFRIFNLKGQKKMIEERFKHAGGR